MNIVQFPFLVVPAVLPRMSCSYSEAAYFEGNHCQHIADYEERGRLQRIEQNNRRAFERQHGRGLVR